jgi:phospholipid/cholesterol/gamma-HCH transport system permease protein
VAAPRMIAAAVACTVLSFWGFVVGTLVGWQASGALMGLPTDMFFLMFYRMIWFRDVVGMLVKGVCFGAFASAVCCHEGLRQRAHFALEGNESEPAKPSGTTTLSGAIVRASCLSVATILLGNMAWFLLVYHAVPIYGPSLLSPPVP